MKYTLEFLVLTCFISCFTPLKARTNVYIINNTNLQFVRGNLTKEWRGFKDILKWNFDRKSKATPHKTIIKKTMKISPASRKKIFSVKRGQRRYKRLFGSKRIVTFEKIKTALSCPKLDHKLTISVMSTGDKRGPKTMVLFGTAPESSELRVSIQPLKSKKIEASYRLRKRILKSKDVVITLNPAKPTKLSPKK